MTRKLTPRRLTQRSRAIARSPPFHGEGRARYVRISRGRLNCADILREEKLRRQFQSASPGSQEVKRPSIGCVVFEANFSSKDISIRRRDLASVENPKLARSQSSEFEERKSLRYREILPRKSRAVKGLSSTTEGPNSSVNLRPKSDPRRHKIGAIIARRERNLVRQNERNTRPRENLVGKNTGFRYWTGYSHIRRGNNAA